MTTISGTPVLTSRLDTVLSRTKPTSRTRPQKAVMDAMKNGEAARLAAQNFASIEGAPMPTGIMRQINKLA